MENMKRVVSLMLCIVMVFGLLPMTVFATDVDTDGEFFEEYIEEEIIVEAPVIENEEPVAPVIPDVPETFESEEEIEIIEEVADLGDANPVDPIADGDIHDSVTITGTYVLTNSVAAGGKYIIASGNTTGNAYALGTDSTGVAVSVQKDGSVTYIDANNNNIVWTASSGLKFQNVGSGKYLSRASGTLSFGNSGANWTYSDYTLRPADSTSRYLQYSNGSWSAPKSSANVYFYEMQQNTYKVTVANPEITMVANGNAQIEATLTKDDETITGLTYTVENGEITVSDTGVITANAAGTAKVLVSYTVDGKTIGKYVDVTVIEPGYYMEITKGGEVVTDVITAKGVKADDTLALGTLITKAEGNSITTVTSLPTDASLQWAIPAEYENIATVDQNGVITFKGADGQFYVLVTLTVNGKSVTDRVDFSVTTSAYSVPSDGTTDFPEYPNEGAIRYDKTASAVGNFSETGIAKMELSMTGVPYTTGSEIDVVIMLDLTGSMSADAISAAEESAIAFAEQIVKNTNGDFNKNRIAVLAFNSGTDSPYTLWPLGTVGEEQWDTFLATVRAAEKKQVSGGTPYSKALQRCYEVLYAAKSDGIGNDRKQFCVFVSDGEPNSVTYITNSTTPTNTTTVSFTLNGQNYTQTVPAYSTGNTSSTFTSTSNNYHEYWSQLMINNGVSVYGVYTAEEGTSASKMASYVKTMGKVADDSSKVFTVDDYENTSALTGVFSGIAKSILQAATDVTVEDKITDEYTMIFDVPTGKHGINVGSQEFYIEFLKYTLDENNERTETVESLTKLSLNKSEGKYSANSAAPVFEQKPIGDKGTLYYWTTDASKGDTGVSVQVGTTTYYFVSYGLEDGYNMTSGAYAAGTVNDHNMSTDLILATPYFVYNANTKMLYWTVDKLDGYEYVLNYFLYLDNSATQVGETDEKEAGTYPTNDHAYITYTNFLKHECRQEFPKPQMTWNGAQASYVFYLVNAQGQPINKSGQVVDFANATFVTDVFTESIIWNKAADDTSEGGAQLNVNWLADDKLPDDYQIYDAEAQYILNVYEKANGETIKNQFTIAGSEANGSTVSTTKVYNTKAGTKYSAYGTYTSTDSNMKGFDFANTTVAFAVVWQPKLVEDTIVVDFGLDVLINVTANDLLQNTVDGIGTSNPGITPVMNTGVSKTSLFIVPEEPMTTAGGNTIFIENENQIRFHQGDMEFQTPDTFYYQSAVSFTEGSEAQKGYAYSSVTVIPATTIYYEDNFVTLESYTWDSTKNGWTKVDGSGVWAQVGTTINATQAQDRPGAANISGTLDADNVYGYDQAYNACTTYSMGSAMKASIDYDNYGTASFTFYGTGFDVISMASNKTGGILVDVYDANGNRVRGMTVDTYYGYEYVECAVTYELLKDGSRREISCEKIVKEENGDSNQVVSVENTEKNTETVNEMRWLPVGTTDDETGIYQVPVIECSGLEYGKYTVTIKCTYGKLFDHGQYDGKKYDFYLDAIRIYDPMNDSAADIYNADGEGWPVYEEIRNNLLDMMVEEEADELPGALFIDGNAGTISIADYANYGANNEVYLKGTQGVAFQLSDEIFNGNIASIQVGMKSADGKPVEVRVYTADAEGDIDSNNSAVTTLSTATGMYYDLAELLGGDMQYKDLQNKFIVIQGTSDNAGLISLTDVKVTFTEQHQISEGLFYVNKTAFENILNTLNTIEPEQPEQGEGEDTNTVFAPTIEIKGIKQVKAGNPVKVEVATSTDVEAITVNGQLVTSYKVKNGERIWTIIIATSASDSAKEISVVAYNADGVASEANTATVQLKTTAQVKTVVNDLISLIKKLLNP